MADERDEDFEIEGGAGDLALRAEMAASEFVLRHYGKIALVVGGVVAAILIYGTAKDWYVSAQQDTSAEIKAAEEGLDADLFVLAQVRAGLRPGMEIDGASTTAVGDALVTISKDANGTAAIEAALKAAEVYRLAGADSKRREALELAASSATGVLGYAAQAAIATLDLEQGKVEEAIARFEELRGGEPFLARMATLDLGGAYETLGRTDEAVATYDAYIAKWPDAADLEEVQQRRERAAMGPMAAAKKPAEAPSEAPVNEEAEAPQEAEEPTP